MQNNLTSARQAIDKYNVMLGLGSTEETIDYLRQESKDAEVNPDRALKMANLSQTLAQMSQSLASIQEKVGGGVLPPQMEEGTPEGATDSEQNQTNFERGAAGPLPEEQRPATDTAREALPPESLGGEVLTP
jgi:hypothetical protein